MLRSLRTESTNRFGEHPYFPRPKIRQRPDYIAMMEENRRYNERIEKATKGRRILVEV